MFADFTTVIIILAQTNYQANITTHTHTHQLVCPWGKICLYLAISRFHLCPHFVVSLMYSIYLLYQTVLHNFMGLFSPRNTTSYRAVSLSLEKPHVTGTFGDSKHGMNMKYGRYKSISRGFHDFARSGTEPFTLRWRHNGRYSVSNHQPHDCLLNGLFRRRSKKTSKLRVTGLCAGNSPGTGEFPAQMASNAENVSIWWRHHVVNRGLDSWSLRVSLHWRPAS